MSLVPLRIYLYKAGTESECPLTYIRKDHDVLLVFHNADLHSAEYDKPIYLAPQQAQQYISEMPKERIQAEYEELEQLLQSGEQPEFHHILFGPKGRYQYLAQELKRLGHTVTLNNTV